MNEHQPILIAAPARCGTTLLAGLLHLHGVWVGEARVTNAPETNSLIGTENIHIKQYCRNLSGNTTIEEFRNNIIEMVDTEGPWLVKNQQLLVKWGYWSKAFPGAKWLLPYRPFEDIIDSAMRHPGMRDKGRVKREAVVRKMQGLQKALAERTPHLWIDMDRLARKDEDVVQEVFDYCNMLLDQQIWDGFVNPEMWHGSAN